MGSSGARVKEGYGDVPFEKNWWEFRQQDIQPERRGYHSTFTYQNKLFVYGGKDIQIGYLDNLWCIDLTELQSFETGTSEY